MTLVHLLAFPYGIPDNQPERKYSLWTFSSERELSLILERIQEEVLGKYVYPLLKIRTYLVTDNKNL